MEEIIIDSGCSYYNKDNYPYCCEIWDNECEAQDCYYKQLKRKEKECEELKEKLKTLDDSVITYELTESDFKKYIKLKQVLQEIKEIIDNNTEPGTITTTSKLCEMLTGIYKKISEVEE